eukprot:g2360.t1
MASKTESKGSVRVSMIGQSATMPPLSSIVSVEDYNRSSTTQKLLFLALLGFTVFSAFTQGAEIGLVLIICQVALACAWRMIGNVLQEPTGDAKMQSIADAIREGSNSFFWRVYGTIFKLSAPMAFVIFFIYFVRSPTAEFESIGTFFMALFIAFSFLVGALCSSMAGYVGLWTSVRVNVRVAAAAADENYIKSIQLALRGGAVAAITVVALVLLGVSSLFVVVSEMYASDNIEEGDGKLLFGRVPIVLVGFGFGASFVALFAQLGGGIFTKAADVGADLVGKVEQDIPEDDPRNPAVIADLVGDNVGDCSARGADLFESIAAEIIAAMILGGTLSINCGLSPSETRGYVLFPLIIHGFDLVVSLCGVYYVDGKDSEQPLTILKRGYAVALGLSLIGFAIATRWLLYAESAPNAWFHFLMCGVVGMATAYFSILTTQYYTDYQHRPVRSIAKASTTGHATNIIAGLSVGLESVMLPSIIISVAILSAYWLGATSGLSTTSPDEDAAGGLFGTAIATMGMLSTAAFVLSMDVFGPIADNAGGIIEMSEQSSAAREITDKLDAVGNTTKAATKGFAVGSAALACFLLVRAFMDEVVAISSSANAAGTNGEETETVDVLIFESIDVAQPEVFVGGLMGAATVFLFAALAMDAVGTTAQAVVNEVRRQFRDLPGIRSGAQKPEYGKCVDIVSAEALRRMIPPGLLATATPIIVGIFFRIFGTFVTKDPLLGAKALTGFMMFSTVSAILLALVLNNSGGAWDNTKKLIETGAHGGKGSEAHKASITGDTVGDPAKDTAGPSLHVLMKMISTVVLVMAPLFVSG